MVVMFSPDQFSAA